MKRRTAKYFDVMKSDTARYVLSQGTNAVLADNPLCKELKELYAKGNSYQKSYSGLNLFDKDSFIYRTGVSTQTIETGIRITALVESSYIRGEYGYFPITGGNQYLLKTDVSVHPAGNETMRGMIIIFEYDENGQMLRETYSSSINTSGTVSVGFTAKPTTVKIKTSFYAAYGVQSRIGATFDFSDIMLIQGSSPVPYEPYVGGNPSPSVNFPQSVQTAKNLKIAFSEDGSEEYVVAPSSLSLSGTTVNLNFAKIGDVSDELIMKNGSVRYIARIGKIDSYASENISSAYISSTGSLSSGATVYYVLASELSYDISETNFGRDLSALKLFGNECTVSAAGDIPVSYLKIKYSEKI